MTGLIIDTSKFVIQPGQRYGFLTTLRAGSTQNKILCQCDCGNEKRIHGLHLRNGNTKSCGCLRIANGPINGQVGNFKHGLKYDRLYDVWSGIKARCYNFKHRSYGNYGARAIGIQESWMQDAAAFISYVSSLPNFDKVESHDLTLDRVDNNKGYEEDNLRWATRREQQTNKGY